MNIFYLDPNPKQCAAQHVDKHCVKMILEYAQLLSTAHRVLDGVSTIDRGGATGRQRTTYILPDSRDTVLYRTTHVNHPSAIWVRQSDSNYIWLLQLLDSLCKEYTYRYGKVHKVEREGLLKQLYTLPTNIPNGEFGDPTPAMPDEYKATNSIQSYHNYYNGPKAHFAKWTKRPTPSWFNG
jgi:hypothetical protein